MKKRAAVFLDRDGVLNKVTLIDGKPYPPYTLSQFEILPGVVEALKDLHNAGFCLVVATNQPDVPTKKTTLSFVEDIHRRLKEALPLDAIKVCLHIDPDNCKCRKPKPGMLLEAAAELNIDLEKSFMVGDRWRDIDAGRNAGTKTVWLRTEYKEEKPKNPDFTADDLRAAAKLILSSLNG